MKTALAYLQKSFLKGSRFVRNLRTDFRYGGFCGGSVLNHHRAGATDVVNTDYDLMPQIFDGEIRPSDVPVDIGCGKGRVINHWLDVGVTNPIFGLELNDEVAAATRKRLAAFPNVTILAGDAIERLPAEGTLFYMFNPFERDITARLSARMKTMFGGRPDFKLVYYAPVHLDVFSEDPVWRVAERRITAIELGRYSDRHRRVALITFR